MSTVLFALACVHRAPTAGPLSEMAGYDKDGNVVIRAATEIIQPNTLFEETDDSEVQWLIDNDAARPATDRECELFNRTGAQ